LESSIRGMVGSRAEQASKQELGLSAAGLPDLDVAKQLLEQEIEWIDLRGRHRLWASEAGAFLGYYLSRKYFWKFLVLYPSGRLYLEKFKILRGKNQLKRVLDLEVEASHPVAKLFLEKIEELIAEEERLLLESLE